MAGPRDKMQDVLATLERGETTHNNEKSTLLSNSNRNSSSFFQCVKDNKVAVATGVVTTLILTTLLILIAYEFGGANTCRAVMDHLKNSTDSGNSTNITDLCNPPNSGGGMP